ncbi:hypothetical protein [Pseudonocardia aurantiaca]|uniref:YybH family protein n=1 Tax=Pseudonocardia aurantiaca TaxID=75290 RepID=A0ABW4FCI8_9PSEU
MSPEELETALEDALVLRDVDGVAGLFEPAGVLDAGPGLRARGRPEIRRVVGALSTEHGFLAGSGVVVQHGNLALVIGDRATSVARLTRAGTWRYAMVVLTSANGGAAGTAASSPHPPNDAGRPPGRQGSPFPEPGA